MQLKQMQRPAQHGIHVVEQYIGARLPGKQQLRRQVADAPGAQALQVLAVDKELGTLPRIGLVKPIGQPYRVGLIEVDGINPGRGVAEGREVEHRVERRQWREIGCR